MAYPTFIGQNLEASVFSASASDTDHPATNLLSGYPDEYWKGAGTGTQWVGVDLGSAKFVNAVAMEFTNIDTMGLSGSSRLVNIESADDAAYSVNLTVQSQIKSDNLLGSDPAVRTFIGGTARYWRVRAVATSGAFTAIPYIGNLFFGKVLSFGHAQNYPFTSGKKDFESTYKSVAIDGRLRRSRVYAGRKNWIWSFSLETNAQITAYDEFLDTIGGNGGPFYCVDGTDINLVMLEESFNPTESTDYNQNNIRNLPFKKVMAG